MPGEAELDASTIAALVLGIIALVSFLGAIFLSSDPFLFFLLAFVTGTLALVFGVRARRGEAAAVAIGAGALLYGITVLAMLTALVYAMGVMMLVILFFFLFFASQPGGSSSGGSSGGCCCADCCNDGCATCCDCGDCCDCGSCCAGGCGSGCCCATVGIVPAILARAPGVPGLTAQEVLARGMAHHPDAPEYAEDVYVIRGVRWCIGCFTTYPVFLVAVCAMVLSGRAPAWPVALALGALLASAQVVSSAGRSRRRWMKASVKTALGLGLALVYLGIHQAPWHAAWKVGALVGVLFLAWLSALPRARRMRRVRAAACAHRLESAGCVTTTSTDP